MDPIMTCRAAHRVDDLTFSPDGRTLAVNSTSFGDTLELFDVQTGARRWKHSAHGSLFTAVTFSADSRLLAVGTNVDRAKVLSVEDGRKVQSVRLTTDTQAFTQASISPDGSRLAVANAPELRLYTVPSGDHLLSLNLGKSWCYGIELDRHGARMATAAENGVYLWNLTTRAAPYLFGPTRGAHSMRFSRCGHVLSAADRNNTLRSWDLRTGVRSSELTRPGYTAYVVLSQDGLSAVAATKDGTVQFWNLATRREWASPVDVGGPCSVALSNDNRAFAVSVRREVKVYPVRPRTPEKTPGAPPPAGCPWCRLPDLPPH